jgi:hypothetical protein
MSKHPPPIEPSTKPRPGGPSAKSSHPGGSANHQIDCKEPRDV